MKIPEFIDIATLPHGAIIEIPGAEIGTVIGDAAARWNAAVRGMVEARDSLAGLDAAIRAATKQVTAATAELHAAAAVLERALLKKPMMQ